MRTRTSCAKKQEKPEHSAKCQGCVCFGGSQGARTINRGLVNALKLLLKDEDVYIIHGTGKQLKGNAYNGMNDVQEMLARFKSNC